MPTKPNPPPAPPPPQAEEEESTRVGYLFAAAMFAALALCVSLLVLALLSHLSRRGAFVRDCESRGGIVMANAEGLEVCLDSCEGRGP